MSGFGAFLKSNRLILICSVCFTGEYYIWAQIQKNEKYVPEHERKDIFVRPLEFAKTLYAGFSPSNDHNVEDEKRV